MGATVRQPALMEYLIDLIVDDGILYGDGTGRPMGILPTQPSQARAKSPTCLRCALGVVGKSGTCIFPDRRPQTEFHLAKTETQT
jgi:hypothetical protein